MDHNKLEGGELKEEVERGGSHASHHSNRRPGLPAEWMPPSSKVESGGDTAASIRSVRSTGGGDRNGTFRDLPEGWVNTDTIRSQLTFRLATSPGRIINPGDTIKSVQSLPKGEDGFIRRQSSFVDLQPEHLISQWPSTAIAGNDILSSCLYSIGLVAQVAGSLTPVAFILVSMVLYLYRGIYAMGVLTFPYNGGSYNLLANVTPKATATAAGCLSIVAYIATSVVSAVSACSYLAEMVPIPPTIAASVLLVAFAILTLTGLKESTVVALSIFAFHLFTLVMLATGCLALACSEGFTILQANMQNPLPPSMSNGDLAVGFIKAMCFGFSTAMLGVSGFESSAQFVESMQPGVFVKTLRNLWASVTVVNPILSLLAISVLPMDEILHNRDTVLAHMMRAFGSWLFGPNSTMVHVLVGWVSFDAFIVLSGAVLTAFVGVDGLIYQLAIDKCMPAFLTRKNKWRGTNHYIIIIFLALSLLLVLIMQGAVEGLAGVYSISFLSVMACFGIGAAMLKASPIYSSVLRVEGLMLPWWHLVAAVALVVVALIGNLVGHEDSLLSFFAYLAPTYLICLACIYSHLLPARCQRLPRVGRGESIEVERYIEAAKRGIKPDDIDGPACGGLQLQATAQTSVASSENVTLSSNIPEEGKAEA